MIFSFTYNTTYSPTYIPTIQQYSCLVHSAEKKYLVFLTIPHIANIFSFFFTCDVYASILEP